MDRYVSTGCQIYCVEFLQKTQYTKRSIYYRKYTLQKPQPSKNRYTQLQYRFAVISEAPSRLNIRIALH